MKTELEPKDSETAIRMLRCLCVCRRPLKQYELLDAASFADMNAISNKDYRLWDNAIDLCKPLIELHPTGTVKFVHFTVRE